MCISVSVKDKSFRKEAAMLNELVLGRALYCQPKTRPEKPATSRVGSASRQAWHWFAGRRH